MGCSCGHPVRIQTSAEKGLMSSDKKRIDIENGEEELIQDYPGQEPDQPGSPEPQPEPEHQEERKVLEGVQLTHSLFTDLLQKEGVKEIDPQGSVFDPELHEAVMAEPSDEEEGIVTRVFERGYMIENRVLRPARVVVSQGRSE